MSAITRHSTPAVDALMDTISHLSNAEKEDLVERVQEGMEDPPVPQWHLDILAEREAEKARGDQEYIPWEQAREQLRQMVQDRLKSK